MASAKLWVSKVRLHLFNQDYIVFFDMLSETKKKKKLRGQVPHLWNCQSIEVDGTVYITGGSLANTKTYLKQTYAIDEVNWELKQLADMNYQRDAHGVIEWRKAGGEIFILAIGSWHVDRNTKTCEIYDIQRNTWTIIPSLNYTTCAPGLIIIKNKLYKLGGTTNIRKVECLDLLKMD
mmetsp:Transcript_12665/g.9190  ORF Transcript_12665/g.9190 Transcript_12665/m.9190 type:complete len:178 (-) Transcript_12665:601-1134(-)